MRFGVEGGGSPWRGWTIVGVLSVGLWANASPATSQIIGLVAGEKDPSTQLPLLRELGPETEFSVPIAVNNASSLAALSFFVQWDTSAFEMLSVTAGSHGNVTFDASGAASGRLGVSLHLQGGIPSTFDAAVLTLRSEDHGGRISLEVAHAEDTLGGDRSAFVMAEDTGLCVGVLGPRGDANRDGSVNIVDAQQIARFSVHLPVSSWDGVERLGDVTEDGATDIVDAQQVGRFSVGLPAVPGVGEEIGGCWTEMYCGGGLTHQVHEVIIGDTVSNTGALDYDVGTGGSASVGVSIRSPVPWLTLPLVEANTPLAAVARITGSPPVQGPSYWSLNLLPSSPSARLEMTCIAVFRFLHPELVSLPYPPELAFSGTSMSGPWTDSVGVGLNGSGEVWGVEVETSVAYAGAEVGWIKTSLTSSSGISDMTDVFGMGPLRVTVDPALLPVGQHSAEVSLRSLRYPVIPPLVVPVHVEVLAAGS